LARRENQHRERAAGENHVQDARRTLGEIRRGQLVPQPKHDRIGRAHEERLLLLPNSGSEEERACLIIERVCEKVRAENRFAHLDERDNAQREEDDDDA
jgi:hypothetical protein